MFAAIFRLISCCTLIFLVGCQSNWAPVDDINHKPLKLSGEHVVEVGETLYSIGWRYNRDYKELAQINDIAPPYEVHTGQRISLSPLKPFVAPKVEVKAQAPTSSPVIAFAPPAPTVAPAPVVPQTTAPPTLIANTSTPAVQTTPPQPMPATVQWNWPVKGEVIGHFAKTKGIDIVGKAGEIVHAAAAGQVVYSGTGLRGYGQLLIIKHNEQYLSAYAHNQRLLVKEGDWVKIGQPIAEMGNTDTNRVKLHFEIRHNGKPVDPMRYLSK